MRKTTSTASSTLLGNLETVSLRFALDPPALLFPRPACRSLPFYGVVGGSERWGNPAPAVLPSSVAPRRGGDICRMATLASVRRPLFLATRLGGRLSLVRCQPTRTVRPKARSGPRVLRHDAPPAQQRPLRRASTLAFSPKPCSNRSRTEPKDRSGRKPRPAPPVSRCSCYGSCPRVLGLPGARRC